MKPEATAKSQVRTYGYQSSSEHEPILELYQVSLCFSDEDDLASFAKFVAECLDGMRESPDWNHEPYYTSQDGGDSIIIARLDPVHREG